MPRIRSALARILFISIANGTSEHRSHQAVTVVLTDENFYGGIPLANQPSRFKPPARGMLKSRIRRSGTMAQAFSIASALPERPHNISKISFPLEQ